MQVLLKVLPERQAKAWEGKMKRMWMALSVAGVLLVAPQSHVQSWQNYGSRSGLDMGPGGGLSMGPGGGLSMGPGGGRSMGPGGGLSMGPGGGLSMAPCGGLSMAPCR